MRSFLSLVVGGLASILLILALVYLLIPNDYTIQTQVRLDKPPARVFPLINNLETWAYWAHRDLKGYHQSFFGAKTGKGAVYEWRSDENYGRIEIIRSEQDHQVALEAYLPNGITSAHTFTIEPTPEGCILKWQEKGSYGWDPRVRAFAWMTGLEGKLSTEYQKTLNSLIQ